MQSQLPTSGSTFPDRVLTEDGEEEYVLLGIDNTEKGHYWPEREEFNHVVRVDEDFEDYTISGLPMKDTLDLYMLGWHWESVSEYGMDYSG